MEKYRRYKNNIEKFLASDKGKRLLNMIYSWGASIVIIGALFKLLHLPYANQILFIALMTEAFVFFVSGFDKPSDDYHWEDVFPALRQKNASEHYTPGVNNSIEKAMVSSAETESNSSQKKSNDLSGNIEKLNLATDQISNMSDLTDATQNYLSQINKISDQMEKLSTVTSSLSDVSNTLLNSYQSITDNSDNLQENSRGYVRQMEMLNRNISGLNTIYEIQLKSISSQIESIEHINGGLQRIKEMYDGSVVDSSVFRRENEQMSHLLMQLNQVYNRMLQAMTVNMPSNDLYANNRYQQQGGYQQPTPPQQDQMPYNPAQHK